MEYFLTSHAQGKPDQHVKLYLKKKKLGKSLVASCMPISFNTAFHTDIFSPLILSSFFQQSYGS